MRPTLLLVLPCLTPDDFTRPGESTATQWVNRHGLTFCTIYLPLKVDVRGRCGALISRNKNRTKPYLEFNFRHKFSLLVVSIMSRCSSARKAGLNPNCYVYILLDFQNHVGYNFVR